MKMRKELWFGFTIMALIVIPVLILTPWGNLVDAHLTRADLGVLGLLMLALIVVAIMLGFPTAFTLMGMGLPTAASIPSSRSRRRSTSSCSAPTA